ncbi:hypothetical protein [Mycolicibacterium sp. XJ1819]
MAERETLWGWDLEQPTADPAEGHLGNESDEPTTDPLPVVVPDQDTQQRNLETPAPQFSYSDAFINQRPGSPISSLTFKAPPPPWYRKKPAMIAMLVVLIAAVTLVVVPLWPRGAAPGADDSVGVAPTTPQPAPTGQPTLTSAPAPPPPPPPAPPPPPPPPADEGAPAVTRQYPVSPPAAGPEVGSRPELGVTRPPISVAPESRTPPTSATVGDGRRKRGGFW